MVSIRIRVENQAALDALAAVPDAFKAAIDSWTSSGSQMVRGVMMTTIRSRQKRRRTGYLSNSVSIQKTPGGFTVGPTAEYAAFVDQPTRDHPIRPVRAKALAFARAGGVITRTRATGHVRTKFRFGGRTIKTDAVFARLVHHPGTKGMFFIDATAEQVEEPLTKMLDEQVRKDIAGLGEA